MKRRTTPTLRVCINLDNSKVSTIDFLFKQIKDEEAPAKLEKSYPTDVTYDTVSQTYLIPFTQEETTLFAPQEDFFMDTRIVTTSGKIPSTGIVQLFMRETLFDEDEDLGEDDEG